MPLLRIALRPWRDALVGQAVAACATGFLLFACAAAGWLERELRPVLQRMRAETVLTAYLDPSVEAGREGAIADSIVLAVGARPEQARAAGSKEVVAEIGERYPLLAREIEELGGEVGAIVPRYVTVAGQLPASAEEKARNVRGVESVETSKDRNRHVLGALAGIRWLARFFVAGLLVACFAGLAHLARMNGYLQQDAVRLMKLLGAGPAELRAPGILSGALAGGAGGVIAAGLWLAILPALARRLGALSAALSELPPPSPAVPLALVAAGVVAGLVSGALSPVSGGGRD